MVGVPQNIGKQGQKYFEGCEIPDAYGKEVTVGWHEPQYQSLELLSQMVKVVIGALAVVGSVQAQVVRHDTALAIKYSCEPGDSPKARTCCPVQVLHALPEPI